MRSADLFLIGFLMQPDIRKARAKRRFRHCANASDLIRLHSMVKSQRKSARSRPL
jgi:hypothetical protein